MRCLRCHQDNPSHAKFCLECGTPFTPTHETGPRGQSYTDLQHALTEALEQQTATAEILRVISSSPAELQPVLDALVRGAVRFCGANDAVIQRLEGDRVSVVAHHGPVPAPLGAVIPVAGTSAWRCVVERRPVQVRDLQAATEEFPEGSAIARELGFRTILSVPLLREDVALGMIMLRRLQAEPFSEKQVTLLQTFADQAVIAIENVRLFRELEAKNRDLTGTLEQQTATSEILRVISSSPTDVLPVFDAIARNAVTLCEARFGAVFRLDRDLVHVVTDHNFSETQSALLRARYPMAPNRGHVSGRAILTGAAVQIPDIFADEEYRSPEGKEAGFRSLLGVPMLRGERAIGAIVIYRTEPGQFPDERIELLQTFAAQAVIAIENVRLFTELQARNAELTESLEQQTATSEVLKTISRSTFDLQPVLDALIESAVRLCVADAGEVYRQVGENYEVVAGCGVTPEIVELSKKYPIALNRGSATGRAILERRVVHIPDSLADPDYTWARREVQTSITLLAVPMLRESAVIGVISVHRMVAKPFTDKQIELVTTFADQAVIAIENVRLFKELEARTRDLTRSVGELRALGDVGRALSSTLDLDAVLQTIVTRASQLAGTDACSVFEYDEATEAFHLRATHNLDEAVVALTRRTPTRKGEGVQGRMAVTRQPVQIPDIAAEDAYRGPLRDILLRTGTRALLAVPMLREDELIGGLTVSRKTSGAFAPEVIELLQTFATQSALAIQNARLFRELADKSRLLETASRHKSEFLANMSHELRTPLNAILGFSEVLAERMFGEVNEKQAEYLQDILSSGRHLLSLINDILDLSKVEAGRLELELGRFHLPTALDNALTLVRERATRHGIALTQTVDDRVGHIVADERKVKQILLNLLSNAVKFTPEGGRVGVTATAADDVVTIAVSDTGIGVAPEDQAAIFEEFRQVGRDDARRQEGTGLGLTLAKKFVELQGGRIWVQSQPDQGSTFTFTLLVRPHDSPSDQRGGAPSLNS